MKMFEEFIYKRNYARFIETKNRREEWDESVSRYADFFLDNYTDKITPEFFEAVALMREKQVVGSMRALWTAGPALKHENLCGYNCGYMPINRIEAFCDYMYLLMCGTGVGFSVEEFNVEKLPIVGVRREDVDSPVVCFEDSREGWRNGFKQVLEGLYSGLESQCSYDAIRPKGSRLTTFGGYASGPEPLKQLVEWATKLFKGAAGRRLTSVEAYDLCCHIASLVIAGGTRRSASIALFSAEDPQMFNAKSAAFFKDNPQRCYANNSKVFLYKPIKKYFEEYWDQCVVNGTGEPGIFNVTAIEHKTEAVGRDADKEYGVNPCFEIILRPNQLCNLAEVIIRPYDSFDVLSKKVRAATALGVYQSMLTNFSPYVSEEFQKNCNEERLLGVSLTGLRDHYVLKNNSPEAVKWLTKLRQAAHSRAYSLCDLLGISRPKAITCVKPSGTVSKLMNTASGLHPRYAPYYIQRIRSAVTDPITKFLMAAGVHWDPETGEKIGADLRTVVFEFPIKSPEGAITVADVDAIAQLEYYHMLQTVWCDHNASCTIYVHPWEWNQVRDWVYENWSSVSGLSFFPVTQEYYDLAPYEAISVEVYNLLKALFPTDVDFSKLKEGADTTTGAHNFACVGGQCEI